MARVSSLIAYNDVAHRLAQLENDFPDDNETIPNPSDWAQEVSGTILDHWQQLLMESTATDLLLNCARQTGKSHVVSLKGAFKARYHARNVVVIAPTLRQSGIVYRRAKLWLTRSGASFERVTAHELVLTNGGSFTALPGDRPDLAIRGDTVDDLIIDEASRIKSELIAAATPSTATRDATITYLSTPAGKRGEFYEAWEHEDWWDRIKITADMCSRIRPSFLAREFKRLGALYAQEYECEFLSSPTSIFSSDDLDVLFRRKVDLGVSDVEIPPRVAVWASPMRLGMFKPIEKSGAAW